MNSIFESLKLQIGSVQVAPGVAQAGIIVFLIFLLLLVMARMSRSYLSWYTSGWYIWVALGFLLAIVIEGFFFISGTTLFTSILGINNAPRPIQTVIDTGRDRIKNVLGTKDQEINTDTVIWDFGSLDEDSQSKVKEMVCEVE